MLAPACLILSLFYGCSKESDSTPNALSASGTSLSTVGDTVTLVLQPGPGEGQDAFVQQYQYHPDNANDNWGTYPELTALTWTSSGYYLRQRIYIKFTGLNAIPANANIISASLSLYGIAPLTSQVTPQGCSIYPGSIYNDLYSDNSCAVLRVTSGDWSQDTITWNNKPDYGGNTAAIIPSSNSRWGYDTTADVFRLVKQIVAQQKNYGFCIRLRYEEIFRSMLFASSESADPTKRPKLVVKYTL